VRVRRARSEGTTVTERSWRADVARRSAPAAVLLTRQPKWLVVVAVAAVFIGGLALRGVLGAVLVLAVAGLLGWLAILRWDHTSPGGRLVRLFALIVLIGFAVTKLF
jgi:hypothetical protein